jgi:hypothetical protein
MFRKIYVLIPLFVFLLAIGCSGGSGGGHHDDSDDDGDTHDGTGSSAGTPYDIGDPVLREIYVSTDGDDSNSGLAIEAPLRTFDAAWAMIPTGTLTETGYRINMVAGTYPCGADESACVNYFDGRSGTYEFPIIVRAIDASGRESNGDVTIRGGFDINEVSYLYLIGLKLVAGNDLPTNNSGNNVLHFANSRYILMRDLTATGPSGRTDTTNTIQEVIKVNQADHVYLESSSVSGTYQTVVDYFSVQDGHIITSEIYGSGGRCAYLKGGSAYFRVEGNEFHDCHEAGFQAGEGSNFPLMHSPWIHYESYDVKFVNNIIHDIYGAGLSVSGSYNVLMAYNTLYKVGLSDGRDWTLAQFVHGTRGCSVVDEYPSAAAAEDRCQALIDDGGYGSAHVLDPGEEGGQWIPDKNVFIYNNIFYNPSGYSTANAQFAVDGPAVLPADAENIPDPSRTDTNLVIKGNIVWNGTGLTLFDTTNGSTPGCADSNPTCNAHDVNADNEMGTIEPELVDPDGGDFQPASGSNVLTATAYEVPAFTWDSFTPDVDEGTLENTVDENFEGEARTGADHPGAY